MYSHLPNTLYTAADLRELDRRAIQDYGIAGYELMTRAATAAFDDLRDRWPDAGSVAVLCGPGNNGGDGYVLARLAVNAGFAVTVLEFADPERLRGDAATARSDYLAAGGRPQPWSGALADADVIVDALLGTGLERPLEGVFTEAIAHVNASRRPVLALDVPSGLHADTGAVLGQAVRAELTSTFIGLKRGLFTADGPDHGGDIRFHDLDVPAEANAGLVPVERLDISQIAHHLRRRSRAAHKGLHGHLLVIGGDHGMGGAARMAGEAALRVGAGLVSLAIRPAHTAAITAARPELMCHGIERPSDLEPLLQRASVVAIGPGLGRGDWGRDLLAQVLETGLPLVVDADALIALADESARRDDWVLTPHPGEAARLLGTTTTAIQQDRFAAATAIRERFGGVCVLKGTGTLVAGPGGVALCPAGNPGMASGGMGDVLTGVVAGLLAQHLSIETAARVGVTLHATAGDRAAAEGERGLLASDLFCWLRRLANP
ncbi:MAG: NAD(P)H-hydrate dehydratase [Ectothiorhodospiraceae bacterium]|jgi:NAD(P)H-hydrate epimerase|nr:NAD(P)H-hydrate dehydratase [Ectothiorhodospiraceae bacterium]